MVSLLEGDLRGHVGMYHGRGLTVGKGIYQGCIIGLECTQAIALILPGLSVDPFWSLKAYTNVCQNRAVNSSSLFG